MSKQRNINNGVPPFPNVTPAYVRRSDGTLEPHPVNGPLIREACEMRADGKSYSTIRRHLAERGLTISMRGLQSTLSSRLLIGEIHFGGFTPNLAAIDEPIIDAMTFRRIQSARVSKGRYSKSERLLARQGVLLCGTCGARLVVHSSVSRNGTRYYYYACSMRCEHPANVRADEAEQIVSDAAIELSRHATATASLADDLEAARVARDAAAEKLSNAIRTLAGIDDAAATREVLDELQTARDVADAEHRRLLALSTPEMTISTATHWDRLTLDEKRAVIHATIASATVTPGRGPGRITIAARLAR